MINSLLGIKKNMTSVYDTRGRRVGATIVELTPNHVTQVKTAEGKDGYSAVQLGIGNKKNIKKPQQGHLKKAGVAENVKFMREIRAENTDDIALGQQIKVKDVLSKGDLVKVTATSKGKGFQGGVKRYGFHGGPKTHGQSDRHRAPGSSGSGTTPGRVYKGHRMAGHMGADTVSYVNLEIVNIDKTNNLVTIKGGIPGPVGGLVLIEKTGIVKGYTPEEEPVVEEENTVSEETVSESAPVEEVVEQSENSAEVQEEAQPQAEEQTEGNEVKE